MVAGITSRCVVGSGALRQRSQVVSECGLVLFVTHGQLVGITACLLPLHPLSQYAKLAVPGQPANLLLFLAVPVPVLVVARPVLVPGFVLSCAAFHPAWSYSTPSLRSGLPASRSGPGVSVVVLVILVLVR